MEDEEEVDVEWEEDDEEEVDVEWEEDDDEEDEEVVEVSSVGGG